MKFLGGSKPRTAPTDVYYPPQVYQSYESFSSDYIPQFREKRHGHSNSQSSLSSHSSRSSHYSNHSRSSSSSSSSSRPRRVSFSHPEKVVYPVAPVVDQRQRQPTYKMQAAAGYSPQMSYAVPAQPAYYYGSGGQVVYAATAVPAVPPKVRGGMPNDSPLSQHREDLSRGRPRSHSVRDKVVLSPGSAVEAVKVPLVAHGPASSYSSHEDRPKNIFGSFINSIRSRSKSKSRERDSVIPSSHSAKSSISSHHGADEHRGRRYEREMRQDVAAELARRMEKDLRLSNYEDPYQTLRRDRSLSQDSTHSARSGRDRDRHERERDRMMRKFRDISPDVQDNTMYNAHYLKYNGSPVMPTHPAASSGYHTDAQPHMLRRSSTSAAHVTKSRPIPASHASHGSERTAPVGWFNRRGDELVRPGTIIRQPPEREYPTHLKRHPDVGAGFMDSKGNVIDANCRLIKRVG